MYFEFIIIYIALGVLFLMMAAVIVLLIKLMKNGGASSRTAYDRGFDGKSHSDMAEVSINKNNRTVQKSGKVVFCKNCATEFNADESVCPNCGMPR